METKYRIKCFRNMKNKIIDITLKNLQKYGLRFSVDDIAKELKISKKTVYKYFSTKEDLAISVYDKFYSDILMESEQIFSVKSNDFFKKTLQLYYASFCMVRNEIFNKFMLNTSIRDFALQNHKTVREKFAASLPYALSGDIMLIIDGAFEKLNGAPLTEEMLNLMGKLL